MAHTLMLVVGKDPHSDLIGFNTEGEYDYGVCIPNSANGKLFTKITADTLTDDLAVECEGLTGAKYNFTTETGVIGAMTGSLGSLTGSSVAFKIAMDAHLNGVFNLLIAPQAVASSAETTSSLTFDVTLDESPDVTDVANWSVDIDAGTPNVVTDVTFVGGIATVTVTDAITVGQVITVSHTAATGDEVDTITALSVTNNEA